jgi:hypothetical protein
MIAIIGRLVVNRAIVAVVGAVGLPSPLYFIAATALAACVAVYSQRLLVAIVLIVATGMISFGTSTLHAAERQHGLRSAQVVAPSGPGAPSGPALEIKYNCLELSQSGRFRPGGWTDQPPCLHRCVGRGLVTAETQCALTPVPVASTATRLS